jgi:hypothetical protein
LAHQRQLIREAVKAALVAQTGAPPAYPTAAGAHVYETRMVPFRKLELPAIAVYALEESVDPDSKNSAPRELSRTLQLAIEGAAEAVDNIDDTLDSLAQQIERVMHADTTLSGTASDSILSDTSIDIADDGKKPLGVVRLVYTVTYYSYVPEAEDNPLDDLNTVHVDYSLGNTQPNPNGLGNAGPQANDESHDVIDLEE